MKFELSNVYVETAVVVLLFSGLYLTSFYNLSTHPYLLFHTLAEFFSIIVACSVFVIAYHSRRFSENKFFLFIGISLLFVGIIDLLHTLAYTGMNIFTGYDSNLPTQLWIFARYFQSITILLSIFLYDRNINLKLSFIIFLSITTIFTSLIFIGIFPDCYIEGTGLTPFKIASEYVIIGISSITLFLYFRNRKKFDNKVVKYIILSLIFLMGGELAFTFYISVYGFSNLVGHFFKILSFYMIYKALIQTTLTDPYSTLFRNLKMSYERLKHRREELSTLYKSIQNFAETDPHAATVLNEKGYIIQINPTFKHLYRRLFNQNIKVGLNFFKKETNKLSELIKNFILNKKDKCEILELDGHFYEICSTHIEDIKHKQQNILILIHNISNFMQIDQMQKRMISTVSHELRNPISVIDMAISNLKKYGDNLSEFQKKELIEMMARNSYTLVQMTEDLSIYSSEKIGRKELNWEEINLLDIIEDLLFQMKLIISEKSIECVLNVDNEIKIYGDPIRIGQILRILIDNAIKYSPENSQIKIAAKKSQEGKYTTQKEKNGIIIEIEDQGIGIREEDIPNLFEPYFRGENAKKIKGTGLGLSVAKELVLKHKGDIFVESEIEKGTKFIIFLPLIQNIEEISVK